MRSILLISMLVLLVSCLVKNKTAIDQDFTLPSKYKEFQLVQKSEMMILTHSKEITSKYPEKRLNIIIYDTKQNKEIFNDHYKNGVMEWINDHIIKVSYTPGNPEKGKSYAYYYDLISKTKQTQLLFQK